MTIKHAPLALFSLLTIGLSAQETSTEPTLKPETKVSYLDSLKSTFVRDEMAVCIDSMWLKELANLDLYDNLSEDITKMDLDEQVDYELSTELLKERLAILDAKSPFNIEYNPGLENIIKSFLKNRKRSYERLMAISEYYFPMFEEALARQNVPLEIKYLAIVESALNPKAVSRMGATGLWQFMYQTGKQYNLKIDSYIDERSDPLKSSEAAAQYMSNMYKIFGDWDLVLASYNSGPGNVAKAIRRSGGKQNYWNIRKYLPRETAGYVPAFLATMYIYEYHKEHGIVPQRAAIKHFETDTIMIKRQISFKQLADLLDMPMEQIEMMNPSYKLKVVPKYSDKMHYLRLPQNKAAMFAANEEKVYAYVDYQDSFRERPFSSQQQYASSDGERVSKTKYYKVRRGDNLSSIAARHGVSLSQLKKWNGLRSNMVIAGKNLKIVSTEVVAAKPKKPVKTEIKAQETEVAEAATEQEETADVHTVQQGENLNGIAKRYNVSVAEIRDWNNFEGNNIQPGMKLMVAQAEVAEAESARPEIRNIEYTVRKGDFLGLIAKRNDVSLEEIREWNNLSGNNIKVGAKLIVKKVEAGSEAVADNSKSDKVSGAHEYLVRKGDSLFSIAKKYPGITVSDLKRWNGIRSETIKPGMKLKING